VKPSQRISVWLETVPVLMRELRADHVSILAHSCGVIYALNTVYAMPQILPPSNPVVYLFSPWVPPRYSGVKRLLVASKMPSPLISRLDSVFSFAYRVIAPPANLSSIVVGAISSFFASSQAGFSEGCAAGEGDDEQDDLFRQHMGISVQEDTARTCETMRRVWEADTRGASGEALLSLRKPQAGSWGVCEEYESCPGKLEERVRGHFCHGRAETCEAWSASSKAHIERPHLVISVLWAETDRMIGKDGASYFDKCFKDFSATSGADCCLLYRSETVPDTDHESVCLPPYGAFPKVCEEIAAKA
jgi:hypothetical protein